MRIARWLLLPSLFCTGTIPANPTALDSPLAWSAPVRSGPDEAKAIRQFQKAFRRVKSGEPNTRARRDALETLAGFDSEKVAKALIKAFALVDAEVAALDAQRQAKSEQQKKMRKGQEFDDRLSLPRPQMELYQQLRIDLTKLRGQVDTRRETLSRIGQVVSERRHPKAVNWLLKTVSGNKKLALYLKLKVAQAAGATGVATLPAMLAGLRKAKEPEEIASLLDGIGMVGKAAQEAAPAVIERLDHKVPIVREHAALALSTLCDPTAIEPMIDLLGRSFGQGKKRIAAYLEALTRQQHGTNASTWKRWFAAEGAKYLAGTAELGGGEPSSRKNSKNYYFGIPQDGKSIVYIIDASGSMKAKVQLKIPKDKTGGTRGKAEAEAEASSRTTSRLEACKAELIRALGLLEATTKFNVIWYSEQPHQFKPAMMLAKPGTIKTAQAWVNKLKPAGSTNIHDSMQMGFQLTGQIAGPDTSAKGPITGIKPKVREAAPDTIFLLSDGSPTLPTMEPDSTEKIIKAVRKWNALKSVVVHCIGIGKGVNEPFMRQLASENGGEFKRF